MPFFLNLLAKTIFHCLSLPASRKILCIIHWPRPKGLILALLRAPNWRATVLGAHSEITRDQAWKRTPSERLQTSSDITFVLQDKNIPRKLRHEQFTESLNYALFEQSKRCRKRLKGLSLCYIFFNKHKFFGTVCVENSPNFMSVSWNIKCFSAECGTIVLRAFARTWNL